MTPPFRRFAGGGHPGPPGALGAYRDREWRRRAGGPAGRPSDKRPPPPPRRACLACLPLVSEARAAGPRARQPGRQRGQQHGRWRA